MRTCSACQKQIPDDARTCAFCGAPVGPKAPQAPDPHETFPGVPPPKEDAGPAPSFSMGIEEPSSLGRNILVAAVVVVVLGGAAAAAYWYMTRGGDAPVATSAPVEVPPVPGMPPPPPDLGGGPAGATAPEASAFVGVWENEDTLTRDKTRIEIAEEGGGLSVHMFERATPGEKDMGTSVGFIDPATGTVALTWALPGKSEEQRMKLLQDGRLKVWGRLQYTQGSTRINRDYDNYFRKLAPPAEEEPKAEKPKPAKGKKGRRR